MTLKFLIKIFEDITPKQQARIVHFLDNYITTQFTLTSEADLKKELDLKK